MSPVRRYDKIAFVASTSPEAVEAHAHLVKRYGNCDPAQADVIVALGGDGLMLQTLRSLMRSGKPVYGMHRGTVGFLMNEFQQDGLPERLAAAEPTVIHPLVMCARDKDDATIEHYAINEVSIFRADLSGGAAAHPDRRQGAAARADGRWRHGGDPGRLHRL